MTDSRKPEPPKVERISANTLLSDFLKDNKMVIGLGQFKTSYTNTGTMIVDKPSIFCVYEDEMGEKGGLLKS